jgi:arsenite-transporting ATPase
LIISNRVLPESVNDEYFHALKDAQQRYGQLVEEAFSPVPILKVPFFEQEVVGLDMLRRMADATYGEQDPTKVFYSGTPTEIEKVEEGGYVLKMKLPFTEKSNVRLTRAGDELAISIGNFRRNIILPRALSTLEVQKARFENGYLLLNFDADGSHEPAAVGNRRPGR